MNPKVSIPIVARVPMTYLLILLTWVFFRSPDWATTQLFFSKIWFWTPTEFAPTFIGVVVAFGAMLLACDLAERAFKEHAFLLRAPTPVSLGLMTAMVVVCAIYMAQGPPAPFLYFQF